MYIPESFKEDNTEHLEKLIRAYPFATLITIDKGAPFVSHIPFLYERKSTSNSVLLGHVAKANPQWQHLASVQSALVIFQGPHAYVSPSWYKTSGVPTWNYAAVHIHGKARIYDNESETENLLERLTAVYESTQDNPWVPNLSSERRIKMLSMIVGFEITIEKMEGKFKLSQNRPIEDQCSVIKHLEESHDQLSVAIATLMKERI